MKTDDGIECKKSGTWVSSDGETGGHYAVFTIDQACESLGIALFSDKQAVLQAMADEDNSEVAQDLTGWGRFERGPGRAFGREPVVRIYRHAVLVYQRTGLDI